jgi:hypothetical protein
MLKPILFFAVLCALLGGLDLLLAGHAESERRDRVRVGRLIPKEEREGRPVAALSLETSATQTKLYAAAPGGLWRCVTYHNAVASEEQIQSVVHKLFEAEGVMQSEDPERSRDYGLDLPTTLRVTLHGANLMKDPKRDLICALEIGNPTHDQDGCYVRRAGSKAIWSVDANPRPDLDLKPGQHLPPLVDPSVIPSSWWKAAKQLKSMRIERAGEAPYELEMRERQLTPDEIRDLRAPPDPSKPPRPRFEWVLKRGDQEQLTEARASGAFMSFLSRTPCRDVLDPALRAQLSLDRPRARLTLTPAQGDPIDLVLAADDAKKPPVVENRGVQSLYEVDPSVAEMLFPRAEQLLDAKAGNPWEAWLKRQSPQGQ